MSATIKVQPKKRYEWNQDSKFIYIRVPMPTNTSLKKIQIFLSDLILRVTSLEKKSTHFLDLTQEIDYLSSQNKFILSDGELHATLKKAQLSKKWDDLLISEITLQELKRRRRQSEARHQKAVQSQEENKKKIKIDYDRKATQQMMKFQEVERKKLDDKKKAEKDQAIRDIFSNVNENTGKIESEERKWAQKQQLALKMIEQQEQSERNKANQTQKSKKQRKLMEQIQNQIQSQSTLSAKVSNPQKKTSSLLSASIFTEQDIDKCEKLREDMGQTDYEQIPVRKATNVQVKFTQRQFPGLAARESYQKQPPMPKPQSAGNAIDGTNETKNPLWLKDKGDSFFKDKNYLSAIEAFTEAVNIDPKMVGSYSNRALCYLKTFNFNAAIADCQKCLSLTQTQLAPEQDKQKVLLFLIKIKSRLAIARAWKGELSQAKTDLEQILNQQDDLKPQICKELNNCREQILLREQSIKAKLKGDEQVKLNNPQKAIKYYDQSIQTDQNQYSLSNKTLCLNKLNRFQKSIQTANCGINKILNFDLSISNANAKTELNKSGKLSSTVRPENILLKLYYRKAKALLQLQRLKQAEQTAHKGISIDSTDKDFQTLLKQMTHQKNKQYIKEQKQKAVGLIKQGSYRQALEIYSRCLKKIESAQETQQYLGILQNQCVCHLKLEDYDSIISTTIRIMNMVNNIKSRIVQFGDRKTYHIGSDELTKISVRTLMRRANAYLHANQVFNAKADLVRALQISPKDESIQKQLQKLNMKLTATPISPQQ